MAHGAFALRAVRGGTVRRRLASPGNVTPRRVARNVLALALTALATLFTAAQGQTAADPLRDAEAAYVAALTTDLGRVPTPDDGVWRAAIDAAELAVALAQAALDQAGTQNGSAQPAAENALRQALALTARVYGSVRWHSRAHSHWLAFVAAGGVIGADQNPPPGLPPQLAGAFPTDVDFATTALNQLAFARYETGDLEAARAYYRELLELDPADAEALRWLARMAFEDGDTETAIDIWSRLVAVAPDDEGARFFLELSRERDEYGAAASEAYRAGIRSYENLFLLDALEHFENAYAANSDFADAAVWAARTAFELGRPAEAEPYWEAALAADPSDDRSAWFLEVTRAQLRWGVAAANDFYAAQSAYATGDLDQAEELFVSATARNPSYVDAWVWAARSSQEAGRAAESIGYWQEVLRLDPNDDRARYFLQVAQQQLAFGPEAGNAFVRGMDAFQAGDVTGARNGFTQAVEAAPTFAAAWGQLGRVEFQVGDYLAAATAYGRALELEPASEEYEFFATEALRLAGLNTAEEVPPASDEEPEDPDIVPLPPSAPEGATAPRRNS